MDYSPKRNSFVEGALDTKRQLSCHGPCGWMLTLAEGDGRALPPSEWREKLLIQLINPCSLLLLAGDRGYPGAADELQGGWVAGCSRHPQNPWEAG